MSECEKVRVLNDEFRTTFSGGRVVVTAGIAARADVNEIIERVRRFSEFTEDNDPHGEHDFGAFVVQAGDTVFWKVDYYGLNQMGSEDPSNPDVTTRVLTIMLAHEY